jgi:hypothetical protein
MFSFIVFGFVSISAFGQTLPVRKTGCANERRKSLRGAILWLGVLLAVREMRG